MAKDKQIILLGAGDHCQSVIDSLLTSYEYKQIGIVDNQKYGSDIKEIMGISIIGKDADLDHLKNQGYTEAFITVGSVGNPQIRRHLYGLAKKAGFNIPNIIDRTSIVSSWIRFGEGIYVGKGAVINANAEIKNMAIINTSSTIEHGCVIGEYVHIAPGSTLCGNVSVEDSTHIGAGSVIKQGVHIGKNVMIGMGSCVISNIQDDKICYGNPCLIKQNYNV